MFTSRPNYLIRGERNEKSEREFEKLEKREKSNTNVYVVYCCFHRSFTNYFLFIFSLTVNVIK